MALEIYQFAFPSSIPQGTVFPSDAEISAGRPGTGINVSGVLAGTAFEATQTRPLDWGRRLPSDSDDGPIASELDNLSYSVSIRRPNVGTFPLEETPESLSDLESDLAPPQPTPGREVFFGTVLDKDKKLYNVVTQEGFLFKATQFKARADDNIEPNTPVIIVRGTKPDEWFVQAISNNPWTNVCTVVGVDAETITCTNELNETISVAKPFSLCKSTFHEITKDGYTYYYLSPTLRRIQSTGADPAHHRYQRVSNGYYKVGDKLVAVRTPYSVGAVTTEWIDLNVDGYNWEYVTTFTGTVVDDQQISENDSPIICKFDFDTSRKTRVYVSTYRLGYKFKDGTKVVFSYNENQDKYFLVEDYPPARKIIGKLKTQMWPTTATVQVEVTKWFDGLKPPLTITAKNVMQYIGNQDNLVVCLRDEDGDYVITDRKNHRRDFITFVLTSKVTGGQANAQVMEATEGGGEAAVASVTVHDDLDGAFDNAAKLSRGHARWRYDTQQYVITQMKCG